MLQPKGFNVLTGRLDRIESNLVVSTGDTSISSLDELRVIGEQRRATDAAFRAAIKSARREGHSLRAIADAAGVNHQTVANILNAAE